MLHKLRYLPIILALGVGGGGLEVEAGGSEVKGYFWLLIKFQSSLSYMRPYFKTKPTNKTAPSKKKNYPKHTHTHTHPKPNQTVKKDLCSLVDKSVFPACMKPWLGGPLRHCFRGREVERSIAFTVNVKFLLFVAVDVFG